MYVQLLSFIIIIYTCECVTYECSAHSYREREHAQTPKDRVIVGSDPGSLLQGTKAASLVSWQSPTLGAAALLPEALNS